MNNADKPAHPVEPDKLGTTNGLTKREYFAAMAMQGLLSNSEYLKQLSHNTKTIPSFDSNTICAMEAIDMADELLKQLEQTKS